jgi:hypothetical protein
MLITAGIYITASNCPIAPELWDTSPVSDVGQNASSFEQLCGTIRNSPFGRTILIACIECMQCLY